MSGATNYVLDRSTSSSGPYAQLYSGTTAAFADSGLQFGTTYYYEVNATTGGGTSTFSSVVSGTTLPGIPTGLSATATSSQAISVSWTAVAGAATYTLQRATSASGPWTQIYTGATAAFGDSGLQAGTTYYYEVRTNTATGNSAYSSSVSATTLAAVPNPPTGLTVSASALQTLSVSWNAVSGATNYVLDRSTSSSGPYAQLYSGTTAAFADSGLQFGTTYYYEVNATTGGGTSTFSSVVSGTTLPGIPTGLSATATSSQAISVSWTAVAGAATYTLQRATSASGPWTQIYTGATAAFGDSGLQAGTTYYYEVRTNTATGNSAYSSSVSATTPAAVPNPPTGLTVSASALQTLSVSWNAVGGATNYVLDRATSSSGPYAQLYSGTTAAFADSGLQFGTTYYYEVNATTGGGTSTFSSPVSATTLSGIPTGLSATATGSQSVSASWNAVTGAATYTLQCASSTSGPWTQIYTGSAAAFGDSGLQAGTTYYYQVRTNTATGNSAYSASVSATTSAAVPQAPALVSPGSSICPGPKLTGTTQTFQWDQVSNATSYSLRVTDLTAGTAVTPYSISSGSTTSYSVSGLNAGDTYYWDMYAFNGSLCMRCPPSITSTWRPRSLRPHSVP